ncbi:MAG: hypothetical protein HKN68_00165 [Saprospiraceae bacterium]|nr:hypothetical protein [Saprospiraceae bacterium]
MKKWFAIIILMIIGFQSLYPQELPVDDTLAYKAINTDNITHRFTSAFIPDNGLNYYVEHYADDVHVHLPVAGGWGDAIPYLHSFNGGSYKWTSHYYNGIKTNNVLIPGDAMFHLTTDLHQITVDAYASEIKLNPNYDSTDHLSVNYLLGDIGSRVGWADWFINNISGHNSAQQRAVMEIEDRMYLPYQVRLKYTKPNEIDQDPFQFQFLVGKRKNIDQDYLGRSSTYDENYYQASLMGSISKQYHYALEWQYRSHAFSEFQYDESETSGRHIGNVSFYSTGDHNYGIHLNVMDLSYQDASFNRNVIDQDGEGLHPFYQDGTQLALTPFYSRKGPLWKKNKWKYNLEFHNSWNRHQPRTTAKSNAIYYQSNDANYRSLHVMDWAMTAHSNWLLNNNATITYEDQEGSTRIKLSSGLNFIGMTYDQSALLHLMPSIDVGIEQDLSDRISIGMRTGLIPRPYDIDQVRFLSRDHLNGTAYYWNDSNGNKEVESSERGTILYVTGGEHRIKGADLGPSKTLYIDVPFKWQASQHWHFKLIPQFRSHRNTWDVQYHPDLPLPVGLNELGSWFYRGGGGQSVYEVIPYSEEWMRDSDGRLRSSLFNQPFYAGITLQFERSSESFYVRGSATGHIIAGGATMGNGPLNNNINQPSDAMSDLNLRYKYLGRIDSDRSYLANFLMGYMYSNHGKMSLQLRYRDGQSFGYYGSLLLETTEGAQVIFNQPLPRGDDPFTRLMGRREDFLLNINLYWHHRLSLSTGNLDLGVQVFNLFDFATEASEFTYGVDGNFLRAPLELQVARTMSFSLHYNW